MSRQIVETQVENERGVQSSAIVDDRRWTWSPSRVIGGLIGIAYMLIGALGVIDAGIDGSLQEPIVSVFGLELSAGVSLGLLALGLLLAVAAASEAARAMLGFVGALSIVAGVLGAAITSDLRNDVGATSSASWFLIISGAVCLVAAWMGTTYFARRDVRERVA